MDLSELGSRLGLRHIAGPAHAEPLDITDDSRRVKPGTLFIARGSGADTASYLRHASELGATAVICESIDSLILPDTISHYQADAVDQPLAATIAEHFFGEPAKRLVLIGVTGTNGKTTTTYLIQHLLQCAGLQTGVIGTIYTDDGTPNGKRPAELTTPGAIELSRELARMADAGCRAVATEVSSHALEQRRVDALSFRAGVFTNLTQDHLDYHQTMEAYAQAKSILFQQLTSEGLAVVNLDDPHARDVLAGYSGRSLWTSMTQREGSSGEMVSFAEEIELHAGSSQARLVGPWGDRQVSIPLIGRHNVSNTLQALAVAYDLVDDSDTLIEAVQTLPQVPGRLECVQWQADGEDPQPDVPVVVVDYSHTPDALENALSSLKPLTPGRLIVVFGCGGDRDKTKRPMMAQAACRYGDRIYLTSDNPRTEDPDAIIQDAHAGVPDARKADLVILPDRAEAIRCCVLEAVPGDTVLLAGKGHETYQTIGHKNIHFDDREHALQALATWVEQKATP